MRECQIRPCSVLTFDEDREKDLIKVVTNLKDRKKLGILMTHLIRIALESPETYGTRNEVSQVLSKLDELGVTPTRYAYFNQITKEVNEVKKKVDTIYEMAYKTYMLAQMGKQLGLEEKSDNLLRSTFLLERQITELCNTIGVSNLTHTFVSNKLEDTHKRADEVLEFILNSYDDIISELKQSLTPQGNVIMMAPNNSMSAIQQNNIPAPTDVSTSSSNQSTQKQNDKSIENETEKSNNSDKEEKAKEETIVVPTGDKAALLLSMMKPKKPGE